MMISSRLRIKVKDFFPALRHRNFRYYWFGMIVSLTGTWIQNIGLSWLIYSITKSPFLLGLAGTLQFLPMLLLSLFAGAVIDKLPKRKILILTQGLSMVTASSMGILVFTGHIRYWHILVLATLLGLINTFDMPTRQSFMIELVGRSDLMNAIALNSAVFNAARIVGPAIAGILMGFAGIAFCFILNALSFIPVLIGLVRIDTEPVIRHRSAGESLLYEVRQGLVYISGSRILYRNILSVTVISIFAMNFSVLVPVLVKNILNHGEMGFGFLMSFMGIGSLSGALLTAVNSKIKPGRLVLILNPLCVAVLLVMIGLSGHYYFTAILLAAAGFFITSFFTTANSTLQVNSKDEFRGRVISVYTLVFGGTTPIGNFFTGSIAEKLGPQAGFIICGIIILVFSAVLLAKKDRNKAGIEGNY
ncbi:MAG: MFS transporter [Clostridia bacterium]|nr:MFS transporter [Clostridia bacterium]